MRSGYESGMSVHPSCWTILPSFGVTVRSVLFGTCSFISWKYQGLQSTSVL